VAGPVDVMIRPEQIRLLRSDSPGVAEDGAERPVRWARVTTRRFFGAEAAVGLALDGTVPDGTTDIVARTVGYDAPLPGSVVGLRVVGQVRVFAPASGDDGGSLPIRPSDDAVDADGSEMS
jgi:hypothetical protein